MNNFKKNLAVKTAKIPKELSLDLLNVPENVSILKSDDNNYIEITNKNFDNPLTFQIPTEKEDFSYLFSHPQVEDFLDRYKLYSSEYKDLIKNYSINERKFLQESFPNMVFNLKIRQKSEYSYRKKLNDIIKDNLNRDLILHDIIAERIIITQFDSSRYPNNPESEDELKEACSKVSNALEEYRSNSCFETSKEKNYMKHPKDNGYESIHIIMNNKENPDCLFETQIRTLEMERVSKTSGEIAHTKYKPRLLNDSSISKLPSYSEVTSFLDENGNPLIVDLSTPESFYHFYGIDLKNYRNQINTVSNLIKEIKCILYSRNSQSKNNINVK